MSAAISFHLSGEVESLKWSGNLDVAVGGQIEVVEEAGADFPDKLTAGLVKLNVQVELIALGRYIAFHDGEAWLHSQRVVANGVLRHCVDIDLALVGVPVGLGEECAKVAVHEREVVNAQLTGHVRPAKEFFDIGDTRHSSAEVNGVEVDQIEHVSHVDIVQLGSDGVCGMVRDDTVEPDALSA